ncbi:MAG: hypothetical protein WDN24_09850 [Sphingomonas sp.]
MTDSSAGSGPFSVTRSVTFKVVPQNISITPRTIPNGQVNAAYSQALTRGRGFGLVRLRGHFRHLAGGPQPVVRRNPLGTPTQPQSSRAVEVTVTDTSAAPAPIRRRSAIRWRSPTSSS